MSTATKREELVKSRLIERIERVGLRVTDIDRALRFYRDVAGLAVLDQDASRAVLGDGEGPAFLVLDSTGVTKPADPHATGLFHTAFRYPSRSSLGDALARLVEAGLELGAGDHLVSEALYVDDPDRNGVELYWDRPREEWPRPANGVGVAMFTAPLDVRALLAEAPA